MRLLADENLELSIIERLREGGHDVATASHQAGTPDPGVLKEVPGISGAGAQVERMVTP